MPHLSIRPCRALTHLTKLIVVISFVIAIFLLQPSPQGQETPDTQKHQNTAKHSPIPSPIFTSAPSAQISNSGACRQTDSARSQLNHNQKWFDPYAAFGPPTWSNWTLAAFAVVAAIIGLRTLSRIKEQNRTSIVALRTNRVAASAARRSADTAEKSVVELERPWVFVDIVKFDGFRRYIPQTEWVNAPLLHGHMQWTIRNYGRSPAFIIDGRIKLSVLKSPLAEPPEYGVNPESSIIPIPMAPNKIQRNRTPWIMNMTDYKLIAEGKAALVFFGFIQYRDTFLKQNHISRWCAILKLPGGFQLIGDSDTYWEFGGPPSYTEYT